MEPPEGEKGVDIFHSIISLNLFDGHNQAFAQISAIFEYHHGSRNARVMGKTDKSTGCSDVRSIVFCQTMEDKTGTFPFIRDNLDRGETTAFIPASAERLESRFFRCKPGGITFKGITPGCAILLLARRKNTINKATSITIDRLPDPVDLNDIDADTENHGSTIIIHTKIKHGNIICKPNVVIKRILMA